MGSTVSNRQQTDRCTKAETLDFPCPASLEAESDRAEDPRPEEVASMGNNSIPPSSSPLRRALMNHKPLSALTLEDFACLFGTTADDIDGSCIEIIKSMDLRYKKLSIVERDSVILDILNRIEAEELAASGVSRKPNWESCWAENLQDFIASGYDVATLVPKYFKKNAPVRLSGDYIIPVDVYFVLNCTRVFRHWLFKKYLQDGDSIYEFGCGPATHLAFLASIYPDKKLYGLDWAKPSQEIIQLMADRLGLQIKGYHFDFFDPKENLHLDKNSRVFTFGALEQIGSNHEAFIQFLLREPPDLCINVECISELYDQSDLTDYLALKYHKRRNYLDGYLTRLRTLEHEGKVEILKVHHQQFGDMFHDAHSYVLWRPT